MTRVRKINVSQVEGNGANSTDDGEIRPFGEIGIYENTDSSAIKTELLMFDGNRSNLRSKVLSKGTFYGGDADGSDGTGVDTIKLIPDAVLHRAGGDYDNDQYVIIDPTGPDHIHIRAGGNIDQSTADLFLGGEQQNVRVSDNTDSVSITTDLQHIWTFDGEGNLTLPTGGDILDSNGDSILGSDNGDQNVWVQTFESEDGAPDDVVAVAASVEYDVNGNIIALFNHFNIAGGSYYSVGKFTSAGVKIWTARFKDDFYTDGWGLAVNGGDGDQIYVAGSTEAEIDSYGKSTLTRLNADDGTVAWSKIYDFGIESTSSVVDVAADGNPVIVGYAGQNIDSYVITTKINSETGAVIWSRSLNGQGDENAYGMAVGAEGEIVVVGYMDQRDTILASYPVTPQTGSGMEVLVINRSDLSGSGEFTTSWKVVGTGIPEYADVTFINSYSGLTSTVQQGSGATFNIADDGAGGYSLVNVNSGGTNYLVGHKIKILGSYIGGTDVTNDATITVTNVDTGTGAITAATITGVSFSTAPAEGWTVGGINIDVGSGLVFALALDSGSTYTEHTFNITAGGTNYVIGDVVVIPGTQLGGTTPENDLTATVSVDNGVVTGFNTFSGTQQTTTYRIILAETEIDFSGTGSWTLNDVEVDQSDRMLVVRYLSDGTIDWQKAVEFDQNYDCLGADADIDSDGNIYVVGEYDRDLNPGTAAALSIVKFDVAGAKIWSRRVVGDCDTFGSSIVVGPDNKLYLSGVTLPEENGKYIWVVAKYGFDGTVEWQRLIENTTSWSFVGGNFFSQGGGSNLAVKQDYVVLGGGFGNLMDQEFPRATMVQISSTGDVFAVGDWEFKAASFSGTLNSSASDINTYPANKTGSDNANGIDTSAVTLDTEVANFLIGTLYRAGGSDERLVNGSIELVLESNGTVTLPAGGTITEGIVTSNPTIQLTPASPSVASQKLVIKGGGNYINTENGIEVSAYNNTWAVNDSVTFYVNSANFANQTLYWWIVPEEGGISSTPSGTVALDSGGGGSFNFTLDSDDYEFTVRVSPEQDNYDPATVGVQSVLMNPDAPTLGDYHLHLTTGDLTETSVFLGTDDHNVRTTTDGSIQITTPNDTNQVWEFTTGGTLILPGSSNGRIAEDEPGVVVYSDTGFAVQTSASTPASDYEVQFTGYIDDGTNSGNAGSTLHITDIAAGAITDGMTVYGAGLPSEGWVLSFGSSVEPIGSGGVGTYLLAGANYLITSQSFNNGVAADIGPKNWIFDNEGELSFPDGTIQTTAYTGNTTTSRPTTTGIPNNFALSPSGTNTNLTPGLYSNILVGFNGKNITLTVQVDSNHNINISGITNATPATFIIGDSAVIDGDVIGGATPADDLTITVDSLENVAIDLTKTINKLTDGNYDLADGVEGQIMYLVRQNETTSANVLVNVENGDGANPLSPFIINAGFADVDNTGICTLIFTDGSWKQTGGNWD